MSEVIRGFWASAVANADFICIETLSGYRSTHLDPKGKQILLEIDASAESLGLAACEAMSHSRFVVPAPREDVVLPPEVEFDSDLFDRVIIVERYNSWIRNLMGRYGYKTKRALFNKMKRCHITKESGIITLVPTLHQKLEVWGREKDDGIEDVIIPAQSSAAEVGESLRLAFSRCTE